MLSHFIDCSPHPFSFSLCLLSTSGVPGMVLGTGNPVVELWHQQFRDRPCTSQQNGMCQAARKTR
jgi:hypothetical protein